MLASVGFFCSPGLGSAGSAGVSLRKRRGARECLVNQERGEALACAGGSGGKQLYMEKTASVFSFTVTTYGSSWKWVHILFVPTVVEFWSFRWRGLRGSSFWMSQPFVHCGRRSALCSLRRRRLHSVRYCCGRCCCCGCCCFVVDAVVVVVVIIWLLFVNAIVVVVVGSCRRELLTVPNALFWLRPEHDLKSFSPLFAPYCTWSRSSSCW